VKGYLTTENSDYAEKEKNLLPCFQGIPWFPPSLFSIKGNGRSFAYLLRGTWAVRAAKPSGSSWKAGAKHFVQAVAKLFFGESTGFIGVPFSEPFLKGFAEFLMRDASVLVRIHCCFEARGQKCARARHPASAPARTTGASKLKGFSVGFSAELLDHAARAASDKTFDRRSRLAETARAKSPILSFAPTPSARPSTKPAFLDRFSSDRGIKALEFRFRLSFNRRTDGRRKFIDLLKKPFRLEDRVAELGQSLMIKFLEGLRREDALKKPVLAHPGLLNAEPSALFLAAHHPELPK
jgi:hypothetical protein